MLEICIETEYGAIATIPFDGTTEQAEVIIDEAVTAGTISYGVITEDETTS